MPSATESKSALAGTKRKSLPVHAKASKKPKIELKSSLKKSSKSAKTIPVKDDADNFSDSDDLESDGGAKLDEEGEDAEEESEFKPEDGLHPDRVKAVVASSKPRCPLILAELTVEQINPRRKLMQSKSNSQMSERLQNP